MKLVTMLSSEVKGKCMHKLYDMAFPTVALCG